FEPVRIILALAAMMRWMVFQFDVKSAFLNGELKEEGWQMQGSSEVIYLTHTRPDLAYAVGLVSRFMHCPSKQHYGATKRILRYIAGTTTYGIWYVRKEKFELVGYCDSDWAGAKDDMKSTSGNCFMFGSGVVTWASKKKAIVALSSTEAECISEATAACQAVWLRRVLEFLNQTQDDKNVQLLSLATTDAVRGLASDGVRGGH
ncbi:retrovirus-related pol polyprotein from transposon TNT 1-94, partial [Tanacetum coccineum]